MTLIRKKALLYFQLYDGVHRGDDPDSKKGAEKSK